VTSLTDTATRWSPDGPDGDAARGATRLLLTCLAVTQVALAAVAAVTLSGGRLEAAVWLDLLVAVGLGAAIVVLARAAQAGPSGSLPDPDQAGALPAPSAPARSRDSALFTSGIRTGESFFDQPTGAGPALSGRVASPGPALADVVLATALAVAALVPAVVAVATLTPWAASSSCLVVLAAAVALQGRRLGVLWAATGAAWAGAAAYGVSGALVAAANGAQVHVGELAPSGLVANWVCAAIAVGASVAVAAVVARQLAGTRAAVARATDAAQSRSVRDPLTGLSNRLGLEMVAGPMIENARRSGQAVHCLYLDVDDFRTLNELAGLHIGDEVLIAVAEAVLGSIRGTDVGARWDGDEFVVVGPGTGTSPLELERRVRAQLAAFPPVPPEVWSGRVSIGSAMLVPWDDGDLDSLLRRADQDMALRRSLRRQGRDRVAGAQGPLASRADRLGPAGPTSSTGSDGAAGADGPAEAPSSAISETPAQPTAPDADTQA